MAQVRTQRERAAAQFMSEAEQRLAQMQQGAPVQTLISLDFDNFNYVNDLYGYHMGDRVLARMRSHMDSVLGENDIFCRLHADHFLFCVETAVAEQAAQLFVEITDLKAALTEFLPHHYTIAGSGGILVVEDASVSLATLLDQANCARKLAKGTASNSFHIYSRKMDESAQWKKKVTWMMETALKEREFEMYLQPKVILKTGEIVGAEALVRWKNAKYGIIYPDQFIPVLEQNGFILQLDFFMLGEACRFLNDCKKNRLPVLPISVNFSKCHLRTAHFVQRVYDTVHSLGLPTAYIEIEFTETIMSENIELLIETVSDLKQLGFRVSLDDFGNGYSSLTHLKDLPIDIVKVDKGFLDSAAGSDKGALVLTKMVELIKSLRMHTVIEGVETAEQLDFLQKLSCDLGQGYYFAKPMPVLQYLDYLAKGTVLEDLHNYISTAENEEVDKSYLYGIPQEFQMDNWELYTLGKNIDMGLMKGYLDEDATVQYVNDRALEYLGYTRQEFREIFHNRITAFTHPEDTHIVQKNAELLVNTGTPLQFQTRAIRKDGKVIVLQGRSSCVLDERDRPVGIYAFQDVTDDLERTAGLQWALEGQIAQLEETVAAVHASGEALRVSEERYRIVAELSNSVVFEWDFIADTLTVSDKYRSLFGREPHSTTGVSHNTELRRYIHPDDVEAFTRWTKIARHSAGRTDTTFRVADVHGNYLWMSLSATGICDQQGVPIRAVGALQDVQAQQALVEDLRLQVRQDPLTGLLNKTACQKQIDDYLQSKAGGSGVFYMLDVDNFKQINDNLGHQTGDGVLKDIATKLRQVFSDTKLVGRIGGDEFAVYLPNATQEEAHRRAQEIIQTLHISCFGANSKYELTGSIGMAQYPEHGCKFSDLYQRADTALYHAKRKGKNRYMIYSTVFGEQQIKTHTPVEYTENFLGNYFQNDMIFRAFAMLYETKDIAASIQMILGMLGSKFDVDRAYIFACRQDCQCMDNTYEWCAPDISPEMQNLQGLSMEVFQGYFAQYSAEGILCCEDIGQSDPAVRELCARQGIKSLLHCAIYKAGVQTGFIGFDFCRGQHSWSGEEIAVLGYTARILSVFMVKNQSDDQEL